MIEIWAVQHNGRITRQERFNTKAEAETFICNVVKGCVLANHQTRGPIPDEILNLKPIRCDWEWEIYMENDGCRHVLQPGLGEESP